MLRALIFIVALAAGGIAAWVSFSRPGTPSAALVNARVADVLPTTEILVASIDIASGAMLSTDAMRWQPWPDASLNPIFITRTTRPDALVELNGMVTRTSLMAGEPVHDGRLIGAGTGFLSFLLTAGMRAVAVRVSAENTAGGFILPNDHVDVIHTVSQVDLGGKLHVQSRVLLRNVRVLAIDQTIADDQSDSVVGKTATLALEAADIETITAAEASGSISFALRPQVDNAETVSVETETPRTVQIYRSGAVELIQLSRPVSPAVPLATQGY